MPKIDLTGNELADFSNWLSHQYGPYDRPYVISAIKKVCETADALVGFSVNDATGHSTEDGFTLPTLGD